MVYYLSCNWWFGNFKNIIEKGFQSGGGQAYNNSLNMNPLTKKNTPICGDGVYITLVIEEAESYSCKNHGK